MSFQARKKLQRLKTFDPQRLVEVVLRAKLLATFMAPATDLVRTLGAGAQNFMYLLAAKERQAAGQ